MPIGVPDNRRAIVDGFRTRRMKKAAYITWAAGVAAALAADANLKPREVAVPELQSVLRKQGALLRTPGEPDAVGDT